MAALLALLPAAGHDQLWFLLMAQRWLDGAVLYGPSNFDSNPPLIVWLSAVPVLLGRLFHISIPATGKLLVLAIEAVTAALSLRFLRRICPRLDPAQITWLLFASICIFAVVPARDLGQRDHLTGLLCLPYVLAAASIDRTFSGSSDRRTLVLRCLAGVFAAVGICLKPHQALIPFAVELTLLLSCWIERPGLTQRTPEGEAPSPHPGHLLSRSPLRSLLRPEPPILLLSGIAFLLLIRRFAPAYFTLALPTLRDTYWAIGHLTPIQLLAESPQLHILAVITVLLFVLRRRASRSGPLRGAILLLLSAGLAATAAFYVQGTGWYYQQLPAISLFACALALQLVSTPVGLSKASARWIPTGTAVLATLALVLTTHFTGYPFTPNRSFAITSPDRSFFEHLDPKTPVAIITTSVDDSMMPVARYNLVWAQRTNNVWTLPAILRSEDPQGQTARHKIAPPRLAELDRRQHLWMVEDLNRWRPDLVLVARCQSPEVHCQELEDRHDDLLAWFNRDPAFQEIWQHYRYLRSSGNYDAYTRTR